MSLDKFRPLFSCWLLVAAAPLAANTLDFGDLPDSPYPTKLSSDGARHGVTQALYLGSQPPDAEPDGLATLPADGDDLTGAPDDEDGVTPASLLPVPGMALGMPVKATNSTGGPAKIFGFADWNADGDFADPGETSSVIVPTGSAGIVFVLPWFVPVTATTSAPVALRLRLSSDTTLGPSGSANNGEVEDFFLTVNPVGSVADFGDLPDAVSGTAAGSFGTGSPPDYKTRASDGGPSHGLKPGLYFPNTSGSPDADVDAESDGRPDINGLGDDTDGNDDETGLTASVNSQTLIPDGMATQLELQIITGLPITNTTGTAANVFSFIDANSDGDFDDPGEQAPVLTGITGTGSATVLFNIKIGGFAPATSFTRSFALRYRISTDATLGPDGPATDGEVHDAVVSFNFQVPNYNTANLDFGDLPAPYATIRSMNGARHEVTQALYLGSTVPDGEPDGLPSTLANGDDTDATDDENGIRPMTIYAVPGMPVSFPVKATNSTGSPAKIFGFADWNADGDFADANEAAVTLVPSGSASVVFSLPWNVPATASTSAPVAVRLRLSTAGTLSPLGRAPDGEVEDFFIVVKSAWLDFGDLPDSAPGSIAGSFSGGATPDYRTLAADNGPSHVIKQGLSLRNDTTSPDQDVDAENDGQTSANADGDDTLGDDDEIGLTITDFYSYYGVYDGTAVRDIVVYFSMPVTNTTGTTAKVYAFVDWDEDGDFTDSYDNLANVGFVQDVVGDGSQTSVRFAGAVVLGGSYGNPAAFTKKLAVRVRLSTDASLSAEGPATDGEVHDEIITLNFSPDPGTTPVMDYGDLPGPYATKHADNGARHVAGQTLYLGALVGDAEADGIPSALANGDDTDATDDENALPAASILPVPGLATAFPLRATNVTGSPAKIFGFVDWNADGDFADADETSAVLVPTGSANTLFSLPWNVPAGASTTAPVAVRLRLTTDLTARPTGLASDGEVEDFFITVHEEGSVKDHGDLPDSAAGSAAGTFGSGSPPDYRTRLADGGPSHGVTPNLLFGGESEPVDLDAEPDGQPDATGTGDDNGTSDDEQGVFHSVTSVTLIPDGMASQADVVFMASLPVVNTTGSDAYVSGFIDVNSDGDFTDPGEQAPVITVPSSASTTAVEPNFTFRIGGFAPATSFSRTFALRFRVTTDAGIGSDGPASNGEVHDELITVNFSLPPYNYADLDFGDLPDGYKTTRFANGARHIINQQLFLGTSSPDGEADGLPSPAANGDDSSASDDENALRPAIIHAVPGSPVTFPVKANNVTGSPATIYGFADWNADGDFLDADETSSIGVPTGSAGVIFNLPWSVPATASITAPVAVRLRLSTVGGLGPVGIAPDGEVEDGFIQVRTTWLDYGDLPDKDPGTAAGSFSGGTTPDYKTREADGGPSHVLRSGLSFANDMGTGDADVDAEDDGLPDSTAGGDDADGDDDELGLLTSLTSVTFTPDGMHSYLDAGMVTSLAVENTTGSTARVIGFIDANSDGDFSDPGEASAVILVPGDGSVSAVTPAFNFRVFGFAPATSFSRTYALRFRITTDASVAADGPAGDGEVHDELVTLNFTVSTYDFADLDFGDLPAGYKTTRADNGARHVISQQLYLGTAPPDGEPDGLPSAPANGDDSNASDDEDGIVPSAIRAHPGLKVKIPVRVSNTTGMPAKLYGFADWNADGDFLDADEAGFIMVPDGTAGFVDLKMDVPSSATTTQPVALRLRLATNTTLGAAGPADNGEVEDIFIEVTNPQLDFGDLPDALTGIAPAVLTSDLSTVSQGDYRTRLADDGPRHVIRPGLVLFDDSNPTGTHIDAEPDGQPSADATGDNTGGSDDEKIMYFAILRQRATNFTATSFDLELKITTSVAVKNETSETATLYGFADLNNDGDFSDSGEAASVSVPSAPGFSAQTLDFTFTTVINKPSLGFNKTVPVRFRLSTDTGLGPDGVASDGEVEDYLMSYQTSWDQWWPRPFGDIPAILLDKGVNSRLDGSRHFGGQQLSNESWTVGQTDLAGPSPLLSGSLLDSLGAGTVPFHHLGSLPDGTAAAYMGFLKARDLPGYRAFMGAAQLTGDTDTPDHDSDGDGLSNYVEYAFGTHPGRADQQPRFQPVLNGDGSGGHELILPYLRKPGGSLNGVIYQTAEIIYAPLGSLNFSSWDMPMEVPLAPPSGLPAAPSGYEWGAVKLVVPNNVTQRGFIKMLISSP